MGVERRSSAQAEEHACGQAAQEKTTISGYEEKAIVVGMLDRETRQVRAQMIPNVKRETLQREVLNCAGSFFRERRIRCSANHAEFT